MEIEDFIDKIVENNKQEDMEKLSEMLEDLMYKIKEYDEKCYDKYKMELYTLAYGYELNEEMAGEIIEKMKPYKMHWTLEQTTDVKKQSGLNDIRDIDFWIVMNMAYNDYHDLFNEDVQMYVNYSKMFIKDEDAKEGKVFKYFTKIV